MNATDFVAAAVLALVCLAIIVAIGFQVAAIVRLARGRRR